MHYRTLGRTGMEVSEIGFGAWGIGKGLWVGAEDGESTRAIHRAVDLGLNFIDTALGYGQGHSEKLVGRNAVSQTRHNIGGVDVEGKKTRVATTEYADESVNCVERTPRSRTRERAGAPEQRVFPIADDSVHGVELT